MTSPTQSPAIEAVAVTFAYGKRPVLREVSVAVRPGEIVALLGPNGCGKSTLLSVLLGRLRGAGTARVCGRDVPRMSDRQRAKLLAYLPQHPTFVPGQTVVEAILAGRFPYSGMLALESEGDERIAREAARDLGLESELPRPIESLSGGQRQRVFIARCLAQQPMALLLDEPDTFLDLRHAALLAGTLRSLANRRGLAVLMASHDIHLAAALADRVVLLSDGVVVASGPPRAVLTSEHLARTYGTRTVTWETQGHWGVGVIY
jgi:iron complex transport system ATP-binding protein